MQLGNHLSKRNPANEMEDTDEYQDEKWIIPQTPRDLSGVQVCPLIHVDEGPCARGSGTAACRPALLQSSQATERNNAPFAVRSAVFQEHQGPYYQWNYPH